MPCCTVSLNFYDKKKENSENCEKNVQFWVNSIKCEHKRTKMTKEENKAQCIQMVISKKCIKNVAFQMPWKETLIIFINMYNYF